MKIFKWEIIIRNTDNVFTRYEKRKNIENEIKRKKEVLEDRKQGLRKCLGHPWPKTVADERKRLGLEKWTYYCLNEYGWCDKCKGWVNNPCPKCKIGNINLQYQKCNYCDYKGKVKVIHDMKTGLFVFKSPVDKS